MVVEDLSRLPYNDVVINVWRCIDQALTDCANEGREVNISTLPGGEKVNFWWTIFPGQWWYYVSITAKSSGSDPAIVYPPFLF